ncbi:MAG: tail fiber domain-containing protein [Phycisphaerae bacterium]|jgi:hypothetical protein
MKTAKMLTILLLALGLMASAAHGSISLTVNGEDTDSIILKPNQSFTVEIVSDDTSAYLAYVGFDDANVLGTFSHLSTEPNAGDLAVASLYNDPAFYGYEVLADATYPAEPSPGVHFVFEYTAQQLGETDVKLYENDPPPSAGPLRDSVHIKVISGAMSTTFTYQGSLSDANSPANGLYDFQFKLYDGPDPMLGIQQEDTINLDEIDVLDGQFTVELDFGSDVFDGNAIWLEIGVRPGDQNDPNVYTTLSPRQEVTPTPYALYAKTAGISNPDSDWIISGNNMYSGVSGNVGIGTAGPGDKLDVTGHINSSESYKLDGQPVVSNAGTENIFIGEDAGVNITTGDRNAAVGYHALCSNNTGSRNSAMGMNALGSNITGNYNSAVGYYALYSNSTGNYNTAVGTTALQCNTTGYNNSAFGVLALFFNTTGYYNSAVGNEALYSNTEGYCNSAVGYYALFSKTTGSRNTAMGVSALYNNTTGNYNTVLGYQAGLNNSTGSSNVFLGSLAGYNETGSNKLYIDNSSTSTPLIYGDFSVNRIGINRVATTNTLEVGGNASKATAGEWLANSDERIKADIQTVTGALETLDKVRLVSFKYRDDYQAKHPGIEKRRYLNVIAQEFGEVFPEYVKSSGEKLANGEEILQVDAYPLTVYSAAAVQELYAIVKAKDAEIATLNERLAKMEATVSRLTKSEQGGQQ